jgi:hypothetical protein
MPGRGCSLTRDPEIGPGTECASYFDLLASYLVTVNTNSRLTKQGIRDLNHYGPKPVKASAEAAAEVSADDVAVAPPVSENAPTAAVPVEE